MLSNGFLYSNPAAFLCPPPPKYFAIIDKSGLFSDPRKLINHNPNYGWTTQ